MKLFTNNGPMNIPTTDIKPEPEELVQDDCTIDDFKELSPPISRRTLSTPQSMKYNALRCKPKLRDFSSHKVMSLYRLLVLELNLPGPRSVKTQTTAEVEERTRAYEQLKSMVSVPLYLEKFVAFGLLVCLNLFLTLFTLVPMKLCILVFTATKECLLSPPHDLSVFSRKLHFVKRDVITIALIVSTVMLLASPVLEVSRLYHDIRGQAHIKLYVMFGVLEVTDKLLSSVSLEVFTVLVGISFSDTSLRNMSKLLLFSILALLFSACHSYALIYQSVSLHVAANSYSNALLTLLLSNQFAELKGAVFKKFEREGLFQVTLSDLTERFQLSIMLFIIAFRNISQLNSTQLGLTPDSWKSWNKWIGAILGPSVVVLGSEIFVDWIKHCFINKFNRIRPKVYDNFLYVLSLDFIEAFNSNLEGTAYKTSDYVKITKRIGIPILSLSVCLFRMILSDLKNTYIPEESTTWTVFSSLILLILSFVALVIVRLLLSLWLLQWAKHIREERERKRGDTKAKTRNAKMTETPTKNNEVTKKEETSLVASSSQTPSTKRSSSGSPDASQLAVIDAQTLISVLNSEDPYTSPGESEIETSFIPGVPNTESSSINPKTRSYLYDTGEQVPPTLEEKRNAQLRKLFETPNVLSDNLFEPLKAVHRYEMFSKRIW